jgi:hypothetical protein
MTNRNIKIFIITISFFASVIVFAKPQWEVQGEMLVPVAGGEAVVFQNKIYILGGYSDSSGTPITSIQEFDPSANPEEQWNIAGKLLVPRTNFVASVWEDLIIVAGGETGLDQTAVNSMEVWGPAYGNMLFDEDVSTNRIGATGEIWNGFFFIVGGYYHGGAEAWSNAIVAFNMSESREWFSFPLPGPQIPYNHASFLLDNAIYIAGGVRTGVSKRIYEFGISGRGIGRIQPDLKQPRASFEAVVVPPNSAYFIGGYNEENKALATTSIFSHSRTGYQLQSASKLNIGRSELMAVKFADTLYVFGGRDARGDVVSTFEKLTLPAVTSVEEKIVHSFNLKQNYPNPFNPSTTLAFELPVFDHVRLDIFAANGTLVRTLLDKNVAAGEHSIVWNGIDVDGKAVPSGVYLYKLTMESSVETRKMLLVK